MRAHGIRPLILSCADEQEAERRMREVCNASLSWTEKMYLHYAPLRNALLKQERRRQEAHQKQSELVAQGFGGPCSAFTRIGN
jgi:hypothetical protein